MLTPCSCSVLFFLLPLLTFLWAFIKSFKALFVNFYHKILKSIRIMVQSEWYDILIHSFFIRECCFFEPGWIFFFFPADFSLKMFLYYSWIIIEKERICNILFAVCSLFLAVFHRYVFHVPFIELSLALIIWLSLMQVSMFCWVVLPWEEGIIWYG